MSKIDDKQLAIASVYARSMLELAEQSNATDSLLAELEELTSAIDRDPGLANFVSSPLIDADERRASLETLFRGRASDLMVDSLQVINRKGRLAILPAIVATFRQERQQLRGEIEVEVATAVPLSDALRQRLQGAVNRFTGKTSRLIETVEPELLGGMVLRLGDQKVDSSVARELEKMNEALATRTSHEILRARRNESELAG